MNEEELSYLTADLHYDLESADVEDDMRRLFGRFMRSVQAGGLQAFKIQVPGKYHRTTGRFVFTGDCKGFTYTFEVSLKGKQA